MVGLGVVAHAARLLDDEAASGTVAEELLSGAIACPSPEIVRMALERIDWPRSDPRWYWKLENALYVRRNPDRALLLEGFRLTLNRCDPNVPGSWGATILHAIAASRGGLTADDRLSFAIPVLDAGGRLDLRDNLLKSTPLGWACRWGRIELVRLLLKRGADPFEAETEPWATPLAWAQRGQHAGIASILQQHGADRCCSLRLTTSGPQRRAQRYGSVTCLTDAIGPTAIISSHRHFVTQLFVPTSQAHRVFPVRPLMGRSRPRRATTFRRSCDATLDFLAQRYPATVSQGVIGA